MDSSGVGLSRREQSLISAWERARKKTVRLAEVSEVIGRDARIVVSRLVKKRVLDRIGPGLYAVRPFRSIGRGWAFPAIAAVELQLGKSLHYTGGLSAFTLNGLTEQQHTSLIDVFVTSRRRARRVGNAEVVFHKRPREVFASGTRSIDVDGIAVVVATPARTVIDALDQFRVVGGMREAIRLFKGAWRHVSTDDLVREVLAIGRQSSAQRLGLLLERAGAAERHLRKLERGLGAGLTVHVLIPGAGRDGVLNRRWKIIENDRADE